MDGRTRERWEVRRDEPNSLDAVRVLLALVVMLGHAWPALLGPAGESAWEPVAVATGGRLNLGALAVSGFFAISGLLIAQSWDRARSAREYAGKRLARIVPGYLLAAAASYLLLGPLGAASPAAWFASLDWSEVAWRTVWLREIAGRGAWSGLPCASLNAPSWSVASEAAGYLLIAGVGAWGALRPGRRRFALPLLLGAFTVLLALQQAGRLSAEFRGGWWLDLVPVPWEGDWPRLMVPFLVGATLYAWRDRVPRSGALCAAALAALLASMLLAGGRWLPLALPLAGSYALLYLALLPSPLSGWADRVRGDYSYGIYLGHWGALQAGALFAGPHLPPGPWSGPLSLFALALGPTLLFAWASWHLVERPALGRAGGRRPAPAAAAPVPTPA